MEGNGRHVIIHGESPLKGIERKAHKYLSREWINGKWRYWYKPKNEINANQAKGSSAALSTPGVAKTRTGTDAWKGRSDRELFNRKLQASNRLDKYNRKKKRRERIKKSVEKGRSFLKEFWRQATTKVDTSKAKNIGGNIYVE